MPGELGSVALAQLMAWETKARDWEVIVSSRSGSTHIVCRTCLMTIFPLDWHGTTYVLKVNMILAATVAHLRHAHETLESEVYGGLQVAQSDNGA